MASKQKSVKVYARVLSESGEEELVSVGRSHPGEIRLLRKNGLAEAVGGKIVLNTAPGKAEPAPESTVDLTSKFNEWLGDPSRFERGYPIVGRVSDRIGNDTGRLADEQLDVLRELAEREAEAGNVDLLLAMSDNPYAGFVGFARTGSGYFNTEPFAIHPKTGEAVPSNEIAPLPREVACANAGEWFAQIADRRDKGHILLVSDDPKRLRIGFVDDNTNEMFYVRLPHIKMMKESDTEVMLQFGINHEAVRECMRTNEGRRLLVGDVGIPFAPFSETVEGDTSFDTPFWSEIAYRLEEGLMESDLFKGIDPVSEAEALWRKHGG